MKPQEFKRIYYPKLVKFVYQHKGIGLIVDQIFKPMRKVASAVVSKLFKPIAKKALESGVKHAGERLGKAVSEKSGDLIMKKLGIWNHQQKRQKKESTKPSKTNEKGWHRSYDQ